MMARVFYEKFGKVVEKKVAEFEEQKQRLKNSVRRNLGKDKVHLTLDFFGSYPLYAHRF